MARRKAETFEPVTMGHIQGHGWRDLLVYCDSGRCHHSATMNADWLSDETPVRSLCRRMVCTKCGMIGADVRPDWSPHVNKRRVWSHLQPTSPDAPKVIPEKPVNIGARECRAVRRSC